MPAIEATGLHRAYRRQVRAPGLYGSVRHLFRPRHEEIVAVDGIDLRIEQGEAVGYVGPKTVRTQCIRSRGDRARRAA